MVEAVNSLIYNTLITERAIHLPTFGTLYIERTGAMTEGDTITAPRFNIAFSSHRTAISIVDVIGSAANVDNATANDIYERWRAKSRQEKILQISGVGALRDKTFIADATLINALNNTQFQGLRTSRKRGGGLRCAVALFVVMLLAIGGLYLFNTGHHTTSKPTTKESVEIAPSEVPAPEVEDIIIIEDNIEDELPVNVDEESKDSIASESEINDWTTATDIRHRVIVGSYSTRENAERAINDIERRMPELKCSVYELGSMYAVAIFGSSQNDECVEFMRNYRKHFSQIWIHTPKRYR